MAKLTANSWVTTLGYLTAPAPAPTGLQWASIAKGNTFQGNSGSSRCLLVLSYHKVTMFF